MEVSYPGGVVLITTEGFSIRTLSYKLPGARYHKGCMHYQAKGMRYHTGHYECWNVMEV